MPLVEVENMLERREDGMPYVEMILAQGKANEEGDESSVVVEAALPEKDRRGWHFARQEQNMIKSVPCVVVDLQGRWWELECTICKGNCVSYGVTTGTKYLKGAKGMYDHVHDSHRDHIWDNKFEETLKHCQIGRSFTEEEVKRLKEGDPLAPRSKSHCAPKLLLSIEI